MADWGIASHETSTRLSDCGYVILTETSSEICRGPASRDQSGLIEPASARATATAISNRSASVIGALSLPAFLLGQAVFCGKMMS